MSVVLRRLNPADLSQLIPLNRALFPMDFHVANNIFSADFIASVLKGRNHSVGAFDNGRLVGFMTITRRPSELYPQDWVMSWDIVAVERKYRRDLVIPITVYALRETLLSGEAIECIMRKTTSFRSLLRIHNVFLRYGYRIVLITPHEVIGEENLVLARFEHIFARDRVLRPLYRGLTRLYCAAHVVSALPRRVLRRVIERLPYERVPGWLRRLTFMEVEEPSLSAEA